MSHTIELARADEELECDRRGRTRTVVIALFVAGDSRAAAHTHEMFGAAASLSGRLLLGRHWVTTVLSALFVRALGRTAWASGAVDGSPGNVQPDGGAQSRR